jgi:hypothetical protein
MNQLCKAGSISGKVNRRQWMNIDRLNDGIKASIITLNDQTYIKITTITKCMLWVSIRRKIIYSCYRIAKIPITLNDISSSIRK